MVIGLGVQLTYWGDALVRAMIEHGYRVILIDNRDAGLSERFSRFGVNSLAEAFQIVASGEDFRAPYTLYDMADDVLALMDHLEIETAHVVGASMGGMIAQIVTGNHPSRVRSLVSIMSTSGAANLPGTDAIDAPPRPPINASREEQIRFGVEMMRADAGNNPDVFDEAYAELRSANDYDRSHGWSGEGRHFLATMATWDRSPVLKTIKQQALLLHGDMDPYFSLDHAQDLARRLKNSRLVIVEGMGHSIEPALVPKISTAIFDHIDGVEKARSGSQNVM
jgi:pimeloyl-ACP methyl ester carboxylesterase